MQAPPTLISVEEYLNTSFEDSDREYVDDRIVEGTWVIDPEKRRGYIYSTGARHEIAESILWTKNPDIELSLDELFQ